jgi:predicted Zn-dependent protease
VATGVRRGQRFYHGELGITLGFPEGWSIINRADALIGHSADRQAFIAMTLEGNSKGLSARQLLRQRAGGQPLVAERELRQAGLSGYSAIIPGSAPRRVAALLHGERAYLFVAAVRGSTSLESQDARFLEVIGSFRPLAAAERKLAEPLRLDIISVKQGQTMAELARRSKLPGNAEASLRLLNNLYPVGEPRPGDRVKVVH